MQSLATSILVCLWNWLVLWVVWILGFVLVWGCFCCCSCLINKFLSGFRTRIFKRNYFSWTLKGIWEPVSYLLWKAQISLPLFWITQISVSKLGISNLKKEANYLNKKQELHSFPEMLGKLLTRRNSLAALSLMSIFAWITTTSPPYLPVAQGASTHSANVGIWKEQSHKQALYFPVREKKI